MSDGAAAPAVAQPVPAATSPVTVEASAKAILKGSEEKEIILKVYHPTVSANEQWAILDSKWYNGWARYSGLGEDPKKVTGEETGAPRPGPVDNKDIQSAAHPGMLKMDLVESRDYVLVHVDVWAKYMEWYGGGPAFIRGTITEGVSKIVRVEMYPIFLHLHELKGDSADESTATFKPVSTRLSVKDVVATLLTPEEKKQAEEKKDDKKDSPIRIWMWEEPAADDKKAVVAAPGGAAVPAADASTSTPAATPAADATAAAPAATPAADGAAAPAAADAAATAAPVVVRKKDNWRLVEGDITLGTPLEGLGVSREKPIKVLVERQNADGTWPRAAFVKDWRDFEIGDILDVQDTVGKWYESKIRDIKPDQVHTHFIGWADSWDEWIPKSSSRLAKKNTHTTGPRVKPAESSWGGMSWSYGASDDGRPAVPGAVGLRNLGNTCFMNSTLACLSHSPVFTDYFLDNKHDKEINRDNPLGWKGKVAEEYATMTKEVWSDKYTTVAPKKFKDAIGQFAPRFSGYQQQDSSELLSFLLDGLHEDLNRILKKPATSAIESKGRPDPVVADESWVNYKLRNDSMIVDIVQGQLKSRLQCPEKKCNRISITFDPFTFLSAPMPTVVDKLQIINVVFCTPGKQVTIFGCTVPTVGRFSDLRKATSEVSGVPAKRLVFAELWNHRVHRFLGDDAGLSELRPGDHIYAYECPELDDVKESWIPIEVYHQKVERNPAHDAHYAHSREFIASPFGCPRAIAVPRKSTLSSKQLRALIDVCAGPAKPASGESPFKIVALQNDGRSCLKCGYASNCTGCEAPNDDVPMEIGDKYNSKIVFALQWPDISLYNDAPDQMIRDPSASTALARREASVDLGDCLRAFTKEETLSAEDPWYCSDCKDFRQAYKKFDIWRLPQLLIIHLKRFSYTSTYRDKISTFVDFPVDGLDMSQYCPNEEYKGDKGIYDLYGVSNHMGSMGGGHYTAYVRNMSNDKWYCHDDSRVSPVNVSEIKSTSAYVLFYKRRDLPKSRRHESLAPTSPAAAAGAPDTAAAAAASASTSGASTPAAST